MPTIGEFLAALTWGEALSASSWIIAVYALYKLSRDRHIRATDVLLKLEERFDRCSQGREQIEYDREYEKVRASLKASERGGPTLAALDDILRFYIVVYAVRQARQVPNRSLSTSYRYWLAFYYRHDRAELRQYINDVYPTLRGWLQDDARRARRFWAHLLPPAQRTFFRPYDFWEADEYLTDASVMDAAAPEPRAAI